VKAGSEGGTEAGRRHRAALRKAAGQTSRRQAVCDRRKRISAFSEEIMGDIAGLFNADSQISLFEKPAPVKFISDLHEFCDGSDSSKDTTGYETPGMELMSQLPPFPAEDIIATGLPVDADAQPTAPVAHIAAVAANTPDGTTLERPIPAGSSSAEVRKILVGAFGLDSSSFVLRDSTGCVVPASAATLGGKFTLEVPSDRTESVTERSSKTTLKFLQEPPHSAAVWLNTKVTKKGEIAGSCAQHLFSPAPKVGIYVSSDSPAGSATADNREALLAQATATLVNAAGEEAVDKNGKLVLHTGTPVIYTDPVTNECSITWPEMGLLDTSRTVHGMPAKELKVSARECGGNRGAVGWFSLKVSVPGCDDLWLRNPTTGQRAKIIVKNERNAALGWRERAEGPYADHSRCVPSHIDEHGHRLCQHGCNVKRKMLCGHSRTKIKMEPSEIKMEPSEIKMEPSEIKLEPAEIKSEPAD